VIGDDDDRPLAGDSLQLQVAEVMRYAQGLEGFVQERPPVAGLGGPACPSVVGSYVSSSTGEINAR
jgi:hypothetical protein